MLKLSRAQDHLRDLKAAVERFMETEPYVAVAEHQVHGLHKVYRLKVRDVPPDSISLLAGDFLHNARSALDYLAYALAEDGKGKPLNAGERRDVTFPICEDRAKFNEHIRNRHLPWMSNRVRAKLHRIQPYVRFQTPEADPLFAGARLNRIDKHQRLNPVAAGISMNSWGLVAGVPPPRHVPSRRVLKDGAEITRLIFDRPHAYVDVQMGFDFSVAIEGVEWWNTRPLTELFEAIRIHTKLTIDRFTNGWEDFHRF
jgi:hypothetical protein